MAWAISCFSQALYFPATRWKMIPPRKVMPAVRRNCSTAKASLSEDALLMQAAKHTFTFNLIVKQVLGLTANEPQTTKILEDFLTSMKELVSFPLYIPGTPYAKAVQARARISSTVKAIVEERKRNGEKKGDFLDILLSVDGLCEDEKVGLVLDLLLGGYETTSLLMALTLHFLGQPPIALEQLKSVAMSAGKLVFIVTEKQYTRKLDGSIPVLIQSDNWLEIAEEIDDLFLWDAEVWRRPASGNADPLGGDFPLVTKEGYNILDVIFTSPIEDLAQIGKCLDEIQGVVDHGVIFGIACSAIIASQQGLQTVNNLSKNVVREL